MSEEALRRRLDHGAVVDLACRLIEVEGHQDHPAGERPTAEFVAAHLHERLPGRSFDVELQQVEEDRANVVAVLRGDRPGPSLMFNAHLDTVPAYGMADAYRPQVRDGRLYGRGAVDMKGALAAMLRSMEILSAPDVSFAGELLVTAVAGEESGSAGMLALTEAGVGADFAVVGEPTSMQVARAHKGAMWIEVEFEGVATHGSVPHQGVNAVVHAAEFITAVERDLVPALSRRRHPLLGSATISVGAVAGGDRPPMVPARCVVQLDRRWLPGERHGDALEELREVVAGLRARDARVNGTVREMAGTAGFPHAPLDCPDVLGVEMLCDIVSARSGHAVEPVGVQFWTDGALLAAETGTPTVVCGPGSIAQAHSLDEWVSLEQLALAAESYLALTACYLDARVGA